MNINTIRAAVVRGMKTIHDVDVDEQAVERIVIKIRARKLEKRASYAFVAGRNWALDQVKRREAAPRVAQRKLEKQVAELESQFAALKATKLNAYCLAEFERIAPKLGTTPNRVKQLAVLRAAVFEGWSYEVQEVVFSAKRDYVHQLKRRGVKLLWPHISKEFRDFLGCSAP